MLELLAELRTCHAILLVEHDMDVVFHTDEVITVMVSGMQIASGAPDHIRNDAEVRKTYLGNGLRREHDRPAASASPWRACPVRLQPRAAWTT